MSQSLTCVFNTTTWGREKYEWIDRWIEWRTQLKPFQSVISIFKFSYYKVFVWSFPLRKLVSRHHKATSNELEQIQMSIKDNQINMYRRHWIFLSRNGIRTLKNACLWINVLFFLLWSFYQQLNQRIVGYRRQRHMLCCLHQTKWRHLSRQDATQTLISDMSWYLPSSLYCLQKQF